MLNCPVGTAFNTRTANRAVLHIHRNRLTLVIQLVNIFRADRNAFSTAIAFVMINNYVYHIYHPQTW